MERTKYLFIAACAFSLFGGGLTGTLPFVRKGFAQNNRSIYKAYVTGQMNVWKRTMDSLENIPRKTTEEEAALVNYRYGYIAWCIGKKDAAQAEKQKDKAKRQVNALEKKGYNPAQLSAYRAAFIGFEIGLAPYKAPFLGSKSLTFAQQAVRLDSLNVLGIVQLGNIAYYTPALLGGSKKEALKHYLSALKIMESPDYDRKYNWNYLNILVTIIQAYIDQNQYEAARKYCIKALKVEPGFDWVKNKLYPQVIKK